jgi:uncharacterized protein (DUF1330 family)
MAAYVISQIQSVRDPAAFSEYQDLVGPTLAKFAAKVVASGTKIEMVEENWSPVRLVVLEFESLQKAKK